GITRDDFESITPYVHGFVVRRHEPVPSNWRAEYSLDNMLKEAGIPGISDIDTRMLTRILRHHGVMKGVITTGTERVEAILEQLKSTSLMTDQVPRTSTKSFINVPGHHERIVLIDFGAKSGILRELTKRGCNVMVVPHDTSAEQIRRLNPDGIQLSNGPGDP